MRELRLVGRPVSDIEGLLGFAVTVPDRPPEGDPEYGLDRYIEMPQAGIAILVNWDDVVRSVQFYSEGASEGYAPYRGLLPHGLTFGSTRAEVRNAFGSPSDSRDGGGEVLGLKVRPWDWFLYAGKKLHFEYRDRSDGIRLVSAMIHP